MYIFLQYVYEKWYQYDMSDPVLQMSTNRACVSNLSLRISFSMPYDGDAKNWLCILVCHLVLYTHVVMQWARMFCFYVTKSPLQSRLLYNMKENNSYWVLKNEEQINGSKAFQAPGTTLLPIIYASFLRRGRVFLTKN